MENLELLIDLHLDGARQGPGGADETRLALSMSGLRAGNDLRIADIGCGTGASTLILADELPAEITAIDFLPQFLDRLEQQVSNCQLRGTIVPHEASMEALPFKPNSLDAIWSEGAIYNIGFENGVRAWKTFLKPGGILAVSELTWLTAERPAELERFWSEAYPEVGTASEKIAVLESEGYSLKAYFPLEPHCWLDNYYTPLKQRFDGFLEQHNHSDAAQQIVKTEREEIALYERFSAYYSYGFYIARKL